MGWAQKGIEENLLERTQKLSEEDWREKKQIKRGNQQPENCIPVLL